MRSTPQARTGKARYRINAFYDLKERASATVCDKAVDMEGLESSRLGTKIFNCKGVSFGYEGKMLIDGFTYNFHRYEKVGIVGANGAGKSTFLNLLTGKLSPSSGTIERGESLKIGYYTQGGIKEAGFDMDSTVLDTVNDTRLLNRFLFPHHTLNSKLSTLSGGELRRLYLLTILIKAPNMLILDEPTNDLDIVTLNILEEYLLEFKGSLIIVSHDRHFLDRLADHLFVFCGDGTIKDFVGNYSEYRDFIKEYEKSRGGDGKNREDSAAKKEWKENREQQREKRRAEQKIQKELETLEKEIASLTDEKNAIEERLASNDCDIDEITRLSERISQILPLIEAKEERWLELSC